MNALGPLDRFIRRDELGETLVQNAHGIQTGPW